MTNKEAKAFLVDYLNGFGTDEERAELEEWLTKDEKLRIEARTLRNEMQLLRNTLNDPMEEVHLTYICERVISEVRKKRSFGFSHLPPAWRSYVRVSFAVSFAIVALAVIFLINPSGSSLEFPETLITEKAVVIPATQIDQEEVNTVKLILTTDDPKVKIYWTLSSDFNPLEEGE